ncbi:riboflavin synthase [Halolactibacillus halophilus]|uniref:Riboflavin synthase n=1 Tax=Halolactibacillus halophilus TaxID=306540 RepID=A0A1I5QIS5_9BACI|nr:riboflavin synthase [Halolactibacillus halophilus]GEM01815.1 riboflavin synthase subunit alpha [Halolactibacillus halophilus]SFP46125.1 riboflavin synthase [Halolactibacillus halophilus]
MFTGIVEEKGTLQTITKNGRSLVLTVGAEKILGDVHIGDSISVNGVCLTVTHFTDYHFSVDVMPETYEATNLKDLTRGSEVNLERAMHANGRFGGHFVSGHVDHVLTIEKTWRDTIAKYVKITVPTDKAKYLADKGSVTVDGTSLTVFHADETSFTLSLIPETQAATILGVKEAGDTVNIEYDVLMKYMERLLTHQSHEKQSSGVTEEKLKDLGFY